MVFLSMKRKRLRVATLTLLIVSCSLSSLYSFLFELDSPNANVSKGSNYKQKHLIHVINPYVVTKHERPPGQVDTPIGLDQWVSLASIQRSLLHYNQSSTKYFGNKRMRTMTIDFVCAVYESDLSALSSLPCRKVLLERSTQTEYPILQPPRQIPFLQDIIDAATASTSRDDYFVMYTNADIGLTTGFYKKLYNYLRSSSSLDALSINRVTIPTEGGVDSPRLPTSKENWLHYVDTRIRVGETHPGFDCFVIHSSVMERFHFGNLFLGFPPWGNKLHIILAIMANNYINIQSNVQGTFHLGNDKTWSTHSNALNTSTMSREQQDVKRDFCPGRVPGLNNDYYTQNKINCGYLFRPVHAVVVQDKDGVLECINRTVPSFVKRGYESTFLKNYHRILEYNETSGRYRRIDVRDPEVWSQKATKPKWSW